MKKIILLLAVVFVMSSFTTADTNTSIEKVNVEKSTIEIIGPHMILDSCGGSILIDDTGMTQDEIFDFAEFMDWLNCEGGLKIIGVL